MRPRPGKRMASCCHWPPGLRHPARKSHSALPRSAVGWSHRVICTCTARGLDARGQQRATRAPAARALPFDAAQQPAGLYWPLPG